MQKVWLPALFLLAAGLQAQTPPGSYAQADIQYGARIYAGQCTTCHGENGDLISAVDLRAGRFKRVASDLDLRNTVLTGVPGTAMPPFKFSESEVVGILAYVRNMRDFDARSVTLGDAARGRKIFEENGNCTSCHRINGKGSRIAPDLSDIGAVRTTASLQLSLLDPTATMLPLNRYIRAVTRTGKVITGRRPCRPPSRIAGCFGDVFSWERGGFKQDFAGNAEDSKRFWRRVAAIAYSWELQKRRRQLGSGKVAERVANVIADTISSGQPQTKG